MKFPTFIDSIYQPHHTPPGRAGQARASYPENAKNQLFSVTPDIVKYFPCYA
jgi:hypothetical protein